MPWGKSCGENLHWHRRRFRPHPGFGRESKAAVSATVEPAHEPLLLLPGFFPDALGFAFRTTAALLLAYLVAFAIQLDTASSAGLCVAIVAQPTPGMAMSKAVYRALGTILGGIAALVLTGLFPQDRTMLLAGFTLWLGGCTFVAALLRDFRSYGAVLCGYTVGIIAVAGIDTPDDVFLATLNRVAAILLGIAAVAVVNLLISRMSAFDDLVAALQKRLAAADTLALAALAGHDLPTEPMPAQVGAAILGLRTQAGYAAAELPNGRMRRAGATAAIAGLLGMLSATRAIATLMQQPADNPSREAMEQASAQLSGAAPRHPLQFAPATPAAAALLDRANHLLEQRDIVLAGLQTLLDGHGPAAEVDLPVHLDWIGAALSATRTMIAVALGCVFCIYSGWTSTSMLLVQQAAFTALLGMTPNPSAAAVAFGIGLIPAGLAAWCIGFVLLPQASGVVPFCLAIAPFVFAAAMATRHPRTAPYSPGLLLYLALLLSPSNVESFDLGTFLDTVQIQLVAVLFMILAFRFILPVSRKRRLFRLADAVGRQLQVALAGKGAVGGAIDARCKRFDLLAQAQIWLGIHTPARVAVLQRLSAFSELESAMRRAWGGMRALRLPMPAREPDALEAASRDLLAGEHPERAIVVQAAAGLYGSALLMRQHGRALRRYGVIEG